MQKLAVIVRFVVRPEGLDAFLLDVIANGAASREEAGCLQFDVLTDAADNSNTITLYEVYESDAAFDVHLETSHFQAFRTATEKLVVSSSIERLRLRN